MSQRKRQTRQRTKAAAAAVRALGSLIHPHAAGIDVGAKEPVAAIAPGSLADPQVRTFSSCTEGLFALRDWLVAAGPRMVAMESTGNYWLCICALLENAGIEVGGSPLHQPPYSLPPPRWSMPGRSKVYPARRPMSAMLCGYNNSTPPACYAAASGRVRKSSRCVT